MNLARDALKAAEAREPGGVTLLPIGAAARSAT